MHPAITRAAMLYDERDETSGELRKLEQFEQTFLTTVELIRTEHARACGQALRRFGGGSSTLFLATKFRMDADRDAELTQALERYDAANEAQDSELKYLLGVVAEEMEATPFAEAAE